MLRIPSGKSLSQRRHSVAAANVDRHQAGSRRDPLDGDEREIREILVVDRIELVFRDQPLDMRDQDELLAYPRAGFVLAAV